MRICSSPPAGWPRIPLLGFLAVICGCHTFVDPDQFRRSHAAEPVVVDLLHKGRVEEMKLADGRRVQALAVELTAPAHSTWRALSAPHAKVIVPGRHPVATIPRGEEVMPHLLPYDPELGLKRGLRILQPRFEDGTIRELELEFLHGLPSGQKTTTAFVACVGAVDSDEACLVPARSYTLVLRTRNPADLDDGAAYPFLVGKRSREVSALGGLVFLFFLYVITIG